MERLTQKLKRKQQIFSSAEAPQCLIGFDGFTDHITRVVAQRHDAASVTAMESMQTLASYLQQAQGRSCNLELLRQQTKIGGNAPILAQALLPSNCTVHLAAFVGESEAELEPLFTPLTEKAHAVYPLGCSGISECLEFDDGKAILGHHRSILEPSLETILDKLGRNNLLHIVQQSRLIASVNWTMLPWMNELWKYILEHIAPIYRLPEQPSAYLFVDLADPRKRSKEDLAQALELLQQLSQFFNVVLGLNLSEALQVAELLQIPTEQLQRLPPREAFAQLAPLLKERLPLQQIVLHHAQCAVAVEAEQIHTLTPPHCPKPKISTGAGDHFNAGYCLGLLYGLSPQEALQCATAHSAYYVTHGDTASLDELCRFIEQNFGV